MSSLAVVSLGGIFLAVVLIRGGKMYLVGKGLSKESAMEDLKREMKEYEVEELTHDD